MLVWGVFSTHRRLVLTHKCHPSRWLFLWILLRQFLLGPCCPCRVGPSVIGWCSCVVLVSVCWCLPPCRLVVASWRGFPVSFLQLSSVCPNHRCCSRWVQEGSSLFVVLWHPRKSMLWSLLLVWFVWWPLWSWVYSSAVLVLGLDGLVLLAVCLFVAALLNFLLLCRLPHVSSLAKAVLVCCDNLLVLWPLVNWPVLVLLLPLACLRLLLVEVVVC